MTDLAPYTTLGVGGPAATFLQAGTEAEVVDAVRTADAEGRRVVVLGGGSNVVVPDAGLDALVVRVATTGQREEPTADGRVLVRAQAGEPWDPFVARTVAAGYAGVECLSGVPGSTGATPVQNVGAYGQEVSQTVAEVRVLDRRDGSVRTLPAAACGFGYRTSRFKTGEDAGRFVVLEVAFALTPGGAAAPVRYRELATALDVALGESAPVGQVRAAVLTLRRGKGMVLDPCDPDSRSCGSFFTNPLLDPAGWDALVARVHERCGPHGEPPQFPAGDGRVKTSAAWLIERAGFGRGYGGPGARLSGKHTLALTARDGGSAADVLALAREVRDGVRDAFGVALENEPVLLDDAL